MESQRAPRLLIVDDVAANRSLLSRRFSRKGYACVEAESGAEALAAVEREPFDAILLDIMMPDADGLSVLSELRQRYTPVELPIIMVTARTDAATIVDALRRQANDYLTKPIIFEVALARVAAQVEGKLAGERVMTALGELKGANERLRHQTYHDMLTGLPNRSWLSERLASGGDASGREGEGFSALFLLDLDGFKGLNDTLGHSIGDLFLVELSRDLESCLTEGEAIARLGGDEFAVLSSRHASSAAQASLAERLIEVASRERIIQGHGITLSASIGIAETRSSESPEIVLKRADMAMYEAKAKGRSSYCFFRPELDDRLKARQSTLRDLRGALERGEFVLHYQPLVDARTRAVSGYEALLRWDHPRRGTIGPADFIPIAEESGLIVPIGAWVLTEACLKAATIPLHQRVAVNVSPAQFRKGGFERIVFNALARAEIAPSRLEIEITEAMMVEEDGETLDLIRSLKSAGVRLSLDDFGTGYSSLSYLRRFAFDKLKIDRSFICDLDGKPDSEAIVRAICEMAKALSITVTAEGVETDAQAEVLRRLGCSELQGYLFGAPRPDVLAPPVTHGTPTLRR